MAFTVEKMLQLGEFEGCRVLAGGTGLQRIIHCVDTMEIPDITPWIRSGELLLTTGYSLRGHAEKLIPLLASLRQNESAGLVIKTKFTGPLPQEALSFADSIGIPLITLPDDTPFIPLINAIGKCIADEQSRSLMRSLTISKSLGLVQDSPSFFSDVTRILYDYFQLPIIITDFLLDICAAWPEGTKLPSSFNHAEMHVRRMSSDIQSMLFCSRISDSFHLLVQQIKVQYLIVGYIIVIVPTDRNRIKSNEDSLVLNYAANALSMHFSQDTCLHSQTQNKNISLYSRLIDDAYDLPEKELRPLAEQNGWPTPPLYLITMETGYQEGKLDKLTRSPHVQFMYMVRSYLEKTGIHYIIIPSGSTIRCMTPFSDKELLSCTLSLIRDQVENTFRTTMWTAVSDKLQKYSEIKAAHFRALDLLLIGRHTGISIAFQEDFFYETAMLQFYSSECMRAFASRILGTLEKYDAKYGADLIFTLQTLIDNRGIQTKTAAALFLHRNTLLYRLKKIEALTGLDLTDGKDLYKAQTALDVRKYTRWREI